MPAITYVWKSLDPETKKPSWHSFATVERDAVPSIGQTVFFFIGSSENELLSSLKVVDVHYVERLSASREEVRYDLDKYTTTDVRVILKFDTPVEESEIPLFPALCKEFDASDGALTAKVQEVSRILKARGKKAKKRDPANDIIRIFGEEGFQKLAEQIRDEEVDTTARSLLDQVDFGDDEE